MTASTTHTPAIETVELSKAFTAYDMLGRPKGKPVVAVNRVSLTVGEGEIFGLVGSNGAGKTTLIKMLSTLCYPTSGVARISGYGTATDEYTVRRLIGLVTSNERSFYWRLSGYDNLRFFAQLYRIPDTEARTWIETLLRLLKLERIAQAPFDTYSTGIKQRFALARGLLHKPRILFMDEPTKGVDPVAASEIIDLIREEIVHVWQPTILIVSHNLWEIERLCHRVAVMDQGRLVATGTMAELKALSRPGQVYQLQVRAGGSVSFEHLNRLPGLMDPVSVHKRSDAMYELRVTFEREEHLSPLLRAILSHGGEIMKCHLIEEPFDEVFQSLVSTAQPNGSVQQAVEWS